MTEDTDLRMARGEYNFEREDPLAAAKGCFNAITLMGSVWLMGFLLYWVAC